MTSYPVKRLSLSFSLRHTLEANIFPYLCDSLIRCIYDVLFSCKEILNTQCKIIFIGNVFFDLFSGRFQPFDIHFIKCDTKVG